MRKARNNRDKNLEKTVNEILKSRSRSKIYVYLIRKNGAKTEEIIKGTNLHPSTVRETLSKMYDQKLIYRKKIKNDSIGKNPYMYHAIPPVKLLKKYASELEDKLNNLASINLTNHDKNYRTVKIKIREGVDDIWI